MSRFSTLGIVLVLIAGFVILFAVRIPDPDPNPTTATQAATQTTAPTTTIGASTTTMALTTTMAPTTTTLPANCSRGPTGEATGEFVKVPGRQKAPQRNEKHFTYTVEVERGVNLAPQCVARTVHRILNTKKGWPVRGYSFERGGNDLKVTLATASTVDELCTPLETDSRYSCWSGERAVINVERWLTGIPAYRNNVEEYRTYVVNHEVGHGLGFTHVECPGRGEPAPLMQQQTVSMDGCTPNPWPLETEP